MYHSIVNSSWAGLGYWFNNNLEKKTSLTTRLEEQS